MSAVLITIYSQTLSQNVITKGTTESHVVAIFATMKTRASVNKASVLCIKV